MLAVHTKDLIDFRMKDCSQEREAARSQSVPCPGKRGTHVSVSCSQIHIEQSALP